MPVPADDVALRRWWARPERWALVVACGAAGFAFTAVPLLTVGWFGPVPVLAGTLLLGGGLAWVAVDRAPVPVASADPRWFWLVAAALALVSVGVNAARSNEHALLNRDPGVYFNAALVLEHHGSPTYRPDQGGFAGQAQLGQGGPGLIGATGGRTGFQGLHLLPATAAALGWVGGDNALARAPALLGGAFLLYLMAFARRLVGPVAALGVGGTFALLIPFVNGSRDFLSEMVLGPALFAALWALADVVDRPSAASVARWRAALVPGALLGAAAMARIDALLGLVGATAFVGLWLITTRDPEERASAVPVGLAVGVPVLIGIALSGLDSWRNARGYLQHHQGELAGEVALAVLLLVGLALWGVIDRRGREPLHRTWVARRSALAAATVVAVVLAAALLLFVRPHVQSATSLPRVALTEGYQRGEGLPIDGRRSYDEQSARWLVWYLGAVGFAAALAGGAWLAAEVIRGRARRVEVLALTVLLPPLVLYLYRPSIYPDHPWASRRFLPVVFPLLVVLAWWLLARLWSLRAVVGQRTPAWAPTAARAVAGVGAVGVVLLPALALRPIWRFRTYDDMLGQIAQVCAVLPEDAAVVVVGDPAQTFTRPLATECRVPAAAILGTGTPTAALLRDVAEGWAAEGRRLWLVGSSASSLAAIGVEQPQVFTRVEPTALHNTLLQRPDTYVTTTRVLAVGRLPARYRPAP